VGSAALRYVQSINERIVNRVVLNQDDLDLMQLELEAIGIDMCRQLFDPEFVRLLWAHRSEIKSVQVTSFEPYIPWELLRLEHPDEEWIDDKFLCEYGLIRSFGGRTPPKRLKGDDWRYLRASYEHNLHPNLGREVESLRTKLAEYGTELREIEPRILALLSALEDPDFDVLHIVCHGKTELDNIELTKLVLSDRQTPQGPMPVTVEPATVRSRARLRKRLPLIFLNACETAQQAPSLTNWGGWPDAFWDRGAGAFVGTSWAVREESAVAFAEAFYGTLLEGSPLTEATTAGRSAAKAEGDASWLAYVVYGHREARIDDAPAME
jgi:CHAT domain